MYLILHGDIRLLEEGMKYALLPEWELVAKDSQIRGIEALNHRLEKALEKVDSQAERIKELETPEPSEFTKPIREQIATAIRIKKRNPGNLCDVSIRWVLEACNIIDRQTETIKELEALKGGE